MDETLRRCRVHTYARARVKSSHRTRNLQGTAESLHKEKEVRRERERKRECVCERDKGKGIGKGKRSPFNTCTDSRVFRVIGKVKQPSDMHRIPLRPFIPVTRSFSSMYFSRWQAEERASQEEGFPLSEFSRF